MLSPRPASHRYKFWGSSSFKMDLVTTRRMSMTSISDEENFVFDRVLIDDPLSDYDPSVGENDV